MNNLPYLIALNRIPMMGPRKTLRLLDAYPDLSQVFKAQVNDLNALGLGQELIERIRQFDFKSIEADLAFHNSPGQTILSIEDSRYPPLLKEIYDPPIVLYTKGRLDSFNFPTIAMVGSRKPTPQGAKTAYEMAHALAAYPATIVSGLALGIDAKAHEGALQTHGRTIAVMGTGVDVIYPYRHQRLAHEIAEKGLLVSEFPLKTTPNAGHFPRRNRIISGLSLCTLVVEAAIKSGSLITARFALEHNREVMAIPGSIHNTQASGCLKLISEGAALITHPHDVLNHLGLAKQQPTQSWHEAPASTDNGLLQYIGDALTTVDDLIALSRQPHQEVVGHLALLEIQGLITKVPGGYIRCPA